MVFNDALFCFLLASFSTIMKIGFDLITSFNLCRIHFSYFKAKEAEAFLLSLSEEIQRRLEAAGMKGRRLTLKVMIRKAGAPVEPAKFGGHGICDSVAR